VIAATNRNLRAEVRRGAFREDLYFRLATTEVRVPPLRDRMEDLPILLEHFLRIEGANISARDVSPQVIELFAAYRWPGNVRELRNAVRRLIVTPNRPLGEQLIDAPTSVNCDPNDVAPLRAARREAADQFERAYLAKILSLTGGNVSRAASIAEVSRQMMQKMMKKHGRGGETP